MHAFKWRAPWNGAGCGKLPDGGELGFLLLASNEVDRKHRFPHGGARPSGSLLACYYELLRRNALRMLRKIGPVALVLIAAAIATASYFTHHRGIRTPPRVVRAAAIA